MMENKNNNTNNNNLISEEDEVMYSGMPIADEEGNLTGEALILDPIKDPSTMFLEPVRVGECPLCGEATFSENNPDNDPSLSVRCCNCDWYENQFLSWEELSGMMGGFAKYKESTKTEYDGIEFDRVESVNENEELITMTFNRNQLVLLEQWLYASDINKLISSVSEDSKYLVSAAIRGFYSDVCKAIDNSYEERNS